MLKNIQPTVKTGYLCGVFLTVLVAASSCGSRQIVTRDGEEFFRLLLATEGGRFAGVPSSPWPEHYALVLEDGDVLLFRHEPAEPVGIDRLESARQKVIEAMDGFVTGYRWAHEKESEAGERNKAASERGVLWQVGMHAGAELGHLELEGAAGH